MEELIAACVDCLRLRHAKRRMKEAILVWVVVDVLMLVRGTGGLLKEGMRYNYVILFVYV